MCRATRRELAFIVCRVTVLFVSRVGVYSLSRDRLVVRATCRAIELGLKKRFSINRPRWCSDKAVAQWSQGRGFESRLEPNFLPLGLVSRRVVSTCDVAGCRETATINDIGKIVCTINVIALRRDGSINPALGIFRCVKSFCMKMSTLAMPSE